MPADVTEKCCISKLITSKLFQAITPVYILYVDLMKLVWKFSAVSVLLCFTELNKGSKVTACGNQTNFNFMARVEYSTMYFTQIVYVREAKGMTKTVLNSFFWQNILLFQRKMQITNGISLKSSFGTPLS